MNLIRLNLIHGNRVLNAVKPGALCRPGFSCNIKRQNVAGHYAQNSVRVVTSALKFLVLVGVSLEYDSIKDQKYLT